MTATLVLREEVEVPPEDEKVIRHCMEECGMGLTAATILCFQSGRLSMKATWIEHVNE